MWLEVIAAKSDLEHANNEPCSILSDYGSSACISVLVDLNLGIEVKIAPFCRTIVYR